MDSAEGGFLSIPQIARALNLSDGTVRRYERIYRQFFPEPVMIDGWNRYPKDGTVRLVRRISQVVAAGKRSGAVIRELEAEFGKRGAPEPDTEGGTAGRTEGVSADSELLKTVRESLKAVSEPLRGVSETLSALKSAADEALPLLRAVSESLRRIAENTEPEGGRLPAEKRTRRGQKRKNPVGVGGMGSGGNTP